MAYISTDRSNAHADLTVVSRWAHMWVNMWVHSLVIFDGIYIHHISRSECEIFKDSKYDMSSEYVQNTLSARFAIASNKEYICRSCHKSLLMGTKNLKKAT